MRPFVVGTWPREGKARGCSWTPGPFVQLQRALVCPAVPVPCLWPTEMSPSTLTAIAPTPSPPPPLPPPHLWAMQVGENRVAGRLLLAAHLGEETARWQKNQSFLHRRPARSWKWPILDRGGVQRFLRLEKGRRWTAARTDWDPLPLLPLPPPLYPPQSNLTSILPRFTPSTSSTTTLTLSRTLEGKTPRLCRRWSSLCQGTAARTLPRAAHPPCPQILTANASIASDSTSSMCEWSKKQTYAVSWPRVQKYTYYRVKHPQQPRKTAASCCSLSFVTVGRSCLFSSNVWCQGKNIKYYIIGRVEEESRGLWAVWQHSLYK